MILSIDAEKAFDKIQHSFMIKALKKLGIRGMLITQRRLKYNKPRTNIIPNGEQLKLFPLKSRMKQCSLLSPVLFSIVLEFLAEQ
jgi:hypothetical protein